MRLFGKPSPAEESLKQAKQALKEGDSNRALGCLKHGFVADILHKPLYQLAQQILTSLGATEEAELFAQALKNLYNPHAFFDLGYHFVDVGHDSFAVPFLEHANTLAPGQPLIANELALAYAGSFRPHLGRDVLSTVDYSCDWPVEYQYHWCSLLSGDDTTRAEAFLAKTPILRPEEQAERQETMLYMKQKMLACIERRKSISRPVLEIRDWHFIQYGTAILDFFDERITPEGKQVAGGRYVYQAGYNEDICALLQKLQQFLSQTGRTPERVISLPDHDSQIIAHAVAMFLKLPLETANEANLTEPHTLLVASEANAYGEFPSIQETQENQTAFALWHEWTADGAWAIDVVGFMAQTYILPWSADRMSFDEATKTVTRPPADTRPVEVIAAAILAAQPAPDPSFLENLAFYTERKALLTGARAGMPRLPFRQDSPVPGRYFGSG
jgi:hypothetical protein